MENEIQKFATETGERTRSQHFIRARIFGWSEKLLLDWIEFFFHAKQIRFRFIFFFLQSNDFRNRFTYGKLLQLLCVCMITLRLVLLWPQLIKCSPNWVSFFSFFFLELARFGSPIARIYLWLLHSRSLLLSLALELGEHTRNRY